MNQKMQIIEICHESNCRLFRTKTYLRNCQKLIKLALFLQPRVLLAMILCLCLIKTLMTVQQWVLALINYIWFCFMMIITQYMHVVHKVEKHTWIHSFQVTTTKISTISVTKSFSSVPVMLIFLSALQHDLTV